MKVAGVYAVVHVPSGRRYVGSSADVEARLVAHRSLLRRGRHHSVHLQRAWDAAGADAFAFRVVELVVDPADLLAREQAHLDANDDGYNVARVAGAATRGRVMSEAEKQLRRDFNLAHGIRPPDHTGKKRSAVTCAKIGAVHRGKTALQATRDKLRQAHLGSRRTPEAVAKTAAANRGRTRSAAAIANMTAAQNRPDVSARRSASMLAAWARRKAQPRFEETRGAQIQSWLDDHPEVTHYVVLDDDADMGPVLDRLVKTTWEYGLLDEHVDRAAGMLGERRRAARKKERAT